MIRSLLIAALAGAALVACTEYDDRPPPPRGSAYNPPGFVDRDGNGIDDRVERRERERYYGSGYGQPGYGGGYPAQPGYGGYPAQPGYGGYPAQPGGYYGNQQQGYYDRNGVWRSY